MQQENQSGQEKIYVPDGIAGTVNKSRRTVQENP